jgi:maltose O-acetyltransferase
LTTEREKMLSGQLYHALDPELTEARRRARGLLYTLNHSRDGEVDLRRRIISELFGSTGAGTWIEPPFYCDYGSNITLGDAVYFNFNCVVLDPAPVTIGSHVMFRPNVQIYTATHPMDPTARRAGAEYALPISIGDEVWVGGSAVICPGVTIGARSVIGAGSVVTRDVPEGVFAAGNPCRVIRAVE